MVVDTDIAEQFERHLNSPKQTWLLGAGVSFPANIPLMFSLTDIVLKSVREQNFVDDDEANHVLEFITNDCGGKSHIEHHLTHLGDLISIAERSHTNGVDIGAKRIAKEKLVDIHRCLIEKIADTVRWGFRPARLDPAQEEQFGQAGASVVDISGHRKFVEAVFGPNRAGLDFVRSPVEFFTTNYDTLIEDSLALSGIEFQDGFIGGGVGFWSITNYQPLTATRAIVSKLHGSIDWYRPNSGGSMLLRVRNGDTYRYVPNKGDAQYEVAQTAVRRLAREGRKYGLGLMLVSQRPSDIEDTVISQCNSWIVLRLANSSDQEHVSRILPDSLTGMTKMLSSLPRQEALFVGEAAAIPARIRLRTLSRDQLPNSHDISFATGWSSEGTTTEGLTNVVARMTS